jgi:outer membrane protein insertion porin family
VLVGAAWGCGGHVQPATTATAKVTPDAGPVLVPDATDCGSIASTTDPAAIAVVRARGNARLSKTDVCSSISVRAGDRLDEARIASDIHTLWDTRAFDDVQVERKDSGSGGILTYVVRERSLVGHVGFDGATAIPMDDLRFLARLREGDPLDMADVEIARNAIRDAYLDRGYRSVKVELRLDPASPMTADVSYKVDEGQLAVVSKFAFTGTSITTDKELRALIETRGGTVNAPGRPYGLAAAERTVLLVQARLYDRGLLQSKVDAPVLTLSPDGKSLAVTIAVHEGPVFRIGQIRFAGDLAADEKTYLRLLAPQKKGDVFNRSALLEAFERIKTMHGKLGKPVKDISPETELDPDKKTVALKIDIALL